MNANSDFFKIGHDLIFIFHTWKVILAFLKVWEHKGITNKIKQVLCTDNQYTRTFARSPTWGFQRCSFRLVGQCEGLSIVERAAGLAPRSLFI